jgi:hypothetical protein
LLDQHGVGIHVTLGRGTILGVIEQLPGRASIAAISWPV